MATKNLESVYSDDLGEVFLGQLGKRLYVHAHIYERSKLSAFKHYLDVFLILQEKLKARGITELFTYVTSKPKFKFAQWVGFETTYETFHASGKDYEIMKKVFA